MLSALAVLPQRGCGGEGEGKVEVEVEVGCGDDEKGSLVVR